MEEFKITQGLPDFIIKSALAVSLTAAFLLIPFTVNNFIQGRIILGFFTFAVLTLCIINARISFTNKYSLRLNLFGITPILMITTIIAIYNLGVTGSYWAYLGVISFYFMLPEKFAWIANTIFISILIPIVLTTLESTVAVRFFAVLVGLSLSSYFSTHEIYKQHFMFKEQAVTDSLTGLLNRTLLQSSLENAIHQSHRTNTEMTILMLDLDDFKSVNDDLGHDVGDTVLQAMGDYLTQYFRASDMVFRIGGEEFLALIYNTDEIMATTVAEKLREEIEQLSLYPDRKITVSIGVSGFQTGMNWEQWMKHCDQNLYLAKSTGRNRVVV